MEHYGWCVGALWVVCGSNRERNYRLKKKNYLSGPIPYQDGDPHTNYCKTVKHHPHLSAIWALWPYGHI